MNQIEQIIKVVRGLATECPDAIYRNPGRELCSYSTGTAGNGRGCIFGQALTRLSYALPCEINGPQGIANVLRNKGFTNNANRPLVQWCLTVQIEQDNGQSWKRAVEIADGLWPIAPYGWNEVEA